ncbi:MAG TPA: DUF4388 domain-containing protein [Planctomycetota bacterium]|jgi:CRP-like cAMP-binding protein
MADRVVTLIVHDPGKCPALKAGDRWVVSGREVRGQGASLCGHGVCSVFPKLFDLLKTLPAGAPLPDDYLLCDSPGCDAAFCMEVPAAVAESGFTRRLERGAKSATEVIRRQRSFLLRIPKEAAADLAKLCSMQKYQNAQIVLMQGVVGQKLYIIAEGNLEVVKRGEGKDETVLATLSTGDCVGEMSILTGETTSAEVRAKGTASVMSIAKETLEGLLLKHPLLSREFSKLLAERLKATNASLQSELSRGIIGKLSMISLVDLVQALQQSRRTGTLVLNFSGEQARLGFKEGVLRAAVAGTAMGDEAFYKTVCWPDGDFCFEAAELAVDETNHVKTDSMGLLMEGMRRMDEAKAPPPQNGG